MLNEYAESSPFGENSLFSPVLEEKRLTIKYISSQIRDNYFLLYFDISAKYLRSSKASIYVKNNNDTILYPLHNIEIAQNGTVSINVQLDSNLLDQQNSLFARVSCDTETATTEFKINSVSKKKTDYKNLNSKKEFVNEKVWENASRKLGISDPNLLKSIAFQESYLEPFIGNEHTKILYERHRFYELYKSKYGEKKANDLSMKFPNLVNKASGEYGNSIYLSDKGYDKIGANNHQFDRLEQAMKIDKIIAIKSTSFGVFQLMGENYNYSSSSVEEFYLNMETSEVFQINATVDFIANDAGKKDFAKALNSKNWKLVASIYNGKNWESQNPNYAKNIENYFYRKPWIK